MTYDTVIPWCFFSEMVCDNINDIALVGMTDGGKECLDTHFLKLKDEDLSTTEYCM